VVIAEEAYKHPRPISGGAFCLGVDDQWVPFLPEENHLHGQKFRHLWIKSVGSDYGDQAEALKTVHEKTGQDIFVATFSALKKPDTGEVRSYCVWSEGVVAYLPRTDDIFFFRPKDSEGGEIVGNSCWERVQAVLGEKMKPVGLYPERFLVEGFPTEDQLAALVDPNWTVH